MTTATGVPVRPSIGRIVHYRLPLDEAPVGQSGAIDPDQTIAPARVTYVWKGDDQAYMVNLQVDKLDADGSYLVTGVPYHETDSGSWFWPPKI